MIAANAPMATGVAAAAMLGVLEEEDLELVDEVEEEDLDVVVDVMVELTNEVTVLLKLEEGTEVVPEGEAVVVVMVEPVVLVTVVRPAE